MVAENNFHTDQIERQFFCAKIILPLVGINWNYTTYAPLSFLRWLAVGKNGVCYYMCRSYRIHVYKDIWAAAMGKELVLIREVTNVASRYAIVITKQEVIIGQLPKKISNVYLVLLQRGVFMRLKFFRRCLVIESSAFSNENFRCKISSEMKFSSCYFVCDVLSLMSGSLSDTKSSHLHHGHM